MHECRLNAIDSHALLLTHTLTHALTHIHTHTHTYIHTHTHTYTYKYTQTVDMNILAVNVRLCADNKQTMCFLPLGDGSGKQLLPVSVFLLCYIESLMLHVVKILFIVTVSYSYSFHCRPFHTPEKVSQIRLQVPKKVARCYHDQLCKWKLLCFVPKAKNKNFDMLNVILMSVVLECGITLFG